ncbi:MAG: RNA polymerase sigma factor [bacterium]
MRSRRRPLDDQEARAAFEELYEATYRKVLAYCRRRARTLEDAQDVLAATYLVAWRRIEDVASADTPLAWLYGVAWRTLANQNRATERQERLVDRLRRSDTLSSPDPAVAIEGAQELEAIEHALTHLPESDREILRLAAFERLSYQEIGHVMGMTTPAVRSHLYRARHRLQRAFQSAYQGEVGPCAPLLQ